MGVLVISLMHNKDPQTHGLKTKHMYKLLVLVGWESGSGMRVSGS